MISKRSLFRKYSLQCFHRVTQSVMALWDTDTGTRFVQGHLASVQKVMGDIIAKRFSSESIDSLKLNIKSHPPAWTSPLWEVIALLRAGQLSTPNPYPCCRLSIWGGAGDKNHGWVSESCYFPINWNLYAIKQPPKGWKERLVLPSAPQQWLQPITGGCSGTKFILQEQMLQGLGLSKCVT